MKMRNAAQIASSGWVTFLIALLLSSPLIYWGLDRSSPVIVHDFDLFPKEVRAGATIYRKISVTRLKSCATSADVIIIDGKHTRWFIDEPEIDNPGPVGIRDTYTVPVSIPNAAAPGDAELRLTVFRKCNPLHHIFPLVSIQKPIRFTILEAS